MKKIAIIIFSAFIGLSFFAPTIFAYNQTMRSDKIAYSLGENIRVFIYLQKPFPEKMNAFSYSINFDQNKLRFVGFETLKTLSPIWVDAPKESHGNISFSGIFPRGLSGVINPETHETEMPLLVTLIFSAEKIGNTTVSMTNGQVYKDDGAGVATFLPVEKIDLGILKNPDIKLTPEDVDVYRYDKNPPLDFMPEIIQDKNINDNQYSLIFSTTDMESGISHYEVREGSGKWTLAESPYLLDDQDMMGEIKVRAYDNAGNYRDAIAKPRGEMSKSIFYFWILLLILVIILLIIYRKMKK